MSNDAQLLQHMRIVDAYGQPTQEFLKLWQQIAGGAGMGDTLILEGEEGSLLLE